MNIENMEQEFPKMPQSMRDMIEKEVEKQVKVTPQRGYFSLKKSGSGVTGGNVCTWNDDFCGYKIISHEQQSAG